MIDAGQKKELEKRALQLRYDLVEMIGVGNAGHLGGSASLAELVAVLYFHAMNLNAGTLASPDRDRLVLSKGHAALIQYEALCEKGCFGREHLATVKTLGGLLQGHPDLSIPGVEAVTGSLGQGLSVALGMALALRLDKKPARVYAIMGDGEQSEGQIWEAAMAAAAFKTDNLTAFIDNNKIQATGPTADTFDIPNLEKKWDAFGWETSTCDGHDIAAIIAAIEKARTVKGKPQLIVLRTVKGKGFSFAENTAAYHNGILTEETRAQAIKDLDAIQHTLEGGR